MARIGQSRRLTEISLGISRRLPCQRRGTQRPHARREHRAYSEARLAHMAAMGNGLLIRVRAANGSLVGREVLDDRHIDCSPAAQNTCRLDATHTHRQPRTPTFKFAKELQGLWPPRIRQYNPTPRSERTIEYRGD